MNYLIKTVLIMLIILIILLIYMSSEYLYSKYLKYKTEYFALKEQLHKGGSLNNFSIANNNLSNKIFDLISTNDSIFSPISITFALSLLHLSAHGNTDKQLTELFGHKYTLDELNNIYKLFNNEIMKMTNALIINKKYKVNNKYLESISNLALIEQSDFTNINVIIKKTNDYIEKNTNGLIKNTLKENDINNMTIMILINTIYFKANWLHEFNIENTYKERFNNTKQVDMMYQQNNFNYYENNKLQMIELPYKNEDYVMGIILPKDNKIPIINTSQFNDLVNSLQEEKVQLHLPKFKHRKNIQLVPILEKLGVTDLFNNKANLDLAKEAYVSKIIHEAVVIVDEKGTEAAAVTVIIMKQMMAMPTKKPIIFKADHEFIYYIRHIPTNMILFYGNFDG